MVDEPSYEVSFGLRQVAAVLDGSKASLRALSVLKDFAQRYGSRLVLIYNGGDEEFASMVRESLERSGVNYSLESVEDPVDYLRRKAPDLILIPLEGRTGPDALEAAGPILAALAYTESSIMVLRY